MFCVLSITILDYRVTSLYVIYSGIGYETAKELVRRGCNVIITCRNHEKIDATKQRIQNDLLNDNNTVNTQTQFNL